MVMARMRSGFAVFGDTQHLPGYSLLLCDDASVNHLTDLNRTRRGEFLLDMTLIGEAIQSVCAKDGLRRINYEVLGNALEWLHGHVHPRYEWEPPERAEWPVWSYPPEEREGPTVAYQAGLHGALREEIAIELHRRMASAY
jgi:diadenosine tetraphosphate (Ap4A) HIT family hydrolase